jgi:hypothetical protein
MENQISIYGDKPITLPDCGDAVNVKFALIGARRFVAVKAGLSPDDIKNKSMKEVKALAIAAGATTEDVQTWRGEYDAFEVTRKQFSRTAIALFASNPAYRQTANFALNAKGVPIGLNASFRKERSLSVSASARLGQANTRIAELEAKLLRATAIEA